jgi:hypothetical protein
MSQRRKKKRKPCDPEGRDSLGLLILPQWIKRSDEFVQSVLREVQPVRVHNHIMRVPAVTLSQFVERKLPVRRVAWSINAGHDDKDYGTPAQTHFKVHTYQEPPRDSSQFVGWRPVGLLSGFDPTHPGSRADAELSERSVRDKTKGPAASLPVNTGATGSVFARGKLNLVGARTPAKGLVAMHCAQLEMQYGLGRQLPMYVARPRVDNLQATMRLTAEGDTTSRLDLYRLKALDSACEFDETVIKRLLLPVLRTPSGGTVTITVWKSAKLVLVGSKKSHDYNGVRDAVAGYLAHFMVRMGCLTRGEVRPLRSLCWTNQCVCVHSTRATCGSAANCA